MRTIKGGMALAAALLVVLIATAPAGAGTKAMGIDVSRFQGTIDWNSVAGSGIRFAFVQASRGSGSDCTVKPAQCGADPYFATNRAAAEAVGIRVGAYHRAFATGGTTTDARTDAVAESDVFLAQVLRQAGHEEAWPQADDLHEREQLGRHREHPRVREGEIPPVDRGVRGLQPRRTGE